MGDGEGWVALDCPAIALHRLGKALQRSQRITIAIVVLRGVAVECDGTADELRCGVVMPGLMRDHAKEMQRVSVLRLHGNDLPAERFRFTKSPRSVVLDGGSKSFGSAHHIAQAENPTLIAIGTLTEINPKPA